MLSLISLFIHGIGQAGFKWVLCVYRPCPLEPFFITKFLENGGGGKQSGRGYCAWWRLCLSADSMCRGIGRWVQDGFNVQGSTVMSWPKFCYTG